MMKTKLTSQLSYSVLKRSTRLLSVGTTADQDEMNFYSKLSSDWWSDNGVMKPLHSLNMLRVPFIRDGLICTDKRALLQQDSSKPLSGLNILEVGCGGGILTEPLARLGASMTGIDVTENLIECARLHASSDPSVSHIEYIHSTIEEHARTRQDHYDAVVASEVLEHVTEKNMFVDSCSSVLKPGGSLFVTTLNRTLATYVAGICIAEYILRLLPVGTHQYDKCITPSEVKVLFKKCGLSTLLTHGFFYNFVTNTWHWCNSQSVCFATHAVKN